MLRQESSEQNNTFELANQNAVVTPVVDTTSHLIVPLTIMFFMISFSVMAYLLAKEQYRLNLYARNNDTSFSFDDDNNRNDPTECLLSGKLQIDNRYESYQTTQMNIGKNESPENNVLEV